MVTPWQDYAAGRLNPAPRTREPEPKALDQEKFNDDLRFIPDTFTREAMQRLHEQLDGTLFGTLTGRTEAEQPNMQNIPRDWVEIRDRPMFERWEPPKLDLEAVYDMRCALQERGIPGPYSMLISPRMLGELRRDIDRLDRDVRHEIAPPRTFGDGDQFEVYGVRVHVHENVAEPMMRQRGEAVEVIRPLRFAVRNHMAGDMLEYPTATTETVVLD